MERNILHVKLIYSRD